MFSAMLVVHSFLPGQLKAAMQMNWMKPDKWSLSHGAVDSGLVNAVGKPLVQTLETSMRLSDATKLKRMFFHHQNWKIKMKSKHFLHARPPACTKLQPRRDAKQGPCASRNPVLLQMQIPLLHHPARKKIENKSVRGSISRKQTCRVSARKHPSTKNGPRVSLRASCPPVYRAVTTKKNTAQMSLQSRLVNPVTRTTRREGRKVRSPVMVKMTRTRRRRRVPPRRRKRKRSDGTRRRKRNGKGP